jgi:hypothetical protein
VVSVRRRSFASIRSERFDVSLTYLHSAGNDRTRDALKALIEAILSDTSTGDTQKKGSE